MKDQLRAVAKNATVSPPPGLELATLRFRSVPPTEVQRPVAEHDHRYVRSMKL